MLLPCMTSLLICTRMELALDQWQISLREKMVVVFLADELTVVVSTLPQEM